MTQAYNSLEKCIELAQRTMTEFSVSNERGAVALEMLRAELSAKKSFGEDAMQYYSPAVYNALATINSVPNTKVRSTQLIEALKEAVCEMREIANFIKNS